MASYNPSKGMHLGNNLDAEVGNDGIADPCDIELDMSNSNAMTIKLPPGSELVGDIRESTKFGLQVEIPLDATPCHEEVFAHHISSAGDEGSYKFNSAIGILEDVLVSDKFAEIQSHFFEQYYSRFEYGEENKLVYMDIFQQYQAIVEGHIEAELKSNVPEFSMEWLSKMIDENKEFVDMGICEILHSFGDFLAFKELMLRFKSEKEGNALDLSDLIMTSSYRV